MYKHLIAVDIFFSLKHCFFLGGGIWLSAQLNEHQHNLNAKLRFSNVAAAMRRWAPPSQNPETGTSTALNCKKLSCRREQPIKKKRGGGYRFWNIALVSSIFWQLVIYRVVLKLQFWSKKKIDYSRMYATKQTQWKEITGKQKTNNSSLGLNKHTEVYMWLALP